MRAILTYILGVSVLVLSACDMATSAVKSSFSDFADTEVNTAVSTEQSGLLNASETAGTNLGTF